MGVFIIAEAGDNHNGNIDLAYALVDAAVAAGADCVKFQTFITEEVICRNAEKAEYQKENTGIDENQFEMVKNLELSFEQFEKIYEYCNKKGILFMSTPFDLISVDFLKNLDMPYWKIPSGEITNLPYLLRIGEMKSKVILSTGMADVSEIKTAVDILKKCGTNDITILHCNTEYPTQMNDVNLRAMNSLKEIFNTNIGYSDHTLGIEVPIAAVALGAKIIEKHFTLDRNMLGPDHKASLEPKELAEMIKGIRNIERAMGDGVKKPTKSEVKNREIARKSIVARIDIKKGEFFSEINLAVKRPGNGISPMNWFEVLGKKADRDFKKDEMIKI